MTYDADIAEAEARNGAFVAELRDAGVIVVTRDPEHDLCHAMVRAGLADGPIQFWRGATPSLRFKSVHRAAGLRIELGEHYPHQRVKRRTAQDFENSRRGGRQDGDSKVARYLALPGVDEASLDDPALA